MKGGRGMEKHEFVERCVKLLADFVPLNEEGLIGIVTNHELQMDKEEFLKFFNGEYKVLERDDDDYPWELSVQYKGFTIIALSQRNPNVLMFPQETQDRLTKKEG